MVDVADGWRERNVCTREVCINAVVAYHFEVPVKDIHNQAFDKVNGGIYSVAVLWSSWR